MGLRKLDQGASLETAFADCEAEKIKVFNQFVDELDVDNSTNMLTKAIGSVLKKSKD